MSKGSWTRPCQAPKAQVDANWDAIEENRRRTEANSEDEAMTTIDQLTKEYRVHG